MMNSLKYEEGTKLQVAALLEPSDEKYAHFLAVAKGEREDHNMPTSWPEFHRTNAENMLARSGVAADEWTVELRDGKVYLVACGLVDKSFPAYQRAVQHQREYERKIEELRRAMA